MDASGDFAVCDSCGMKHTKDRIKAMAQEVTGTVAVSNIASIESLMKRGHLALEDSDWKQADEYFNKVLDLDAEYAPAYVGKLCTELKVQQEEKLVDNGKSFSGSNHYRKAVRFADEGYRSKLEGYNKTLQERIPDLAEIRKRIAKYQNCIVATYSNTVGLKTDGTVVAIGRNHYGQCNTESWRDIVTISSTGNYTVGLKSDGTVVVAGCYTTDLFGEVRKNFDINGWRDIVAISTGDDYIVGLKSDGRVIANGGKNNYGQCNIESWRDIVAIDVHHNYTVGLKSDGTVVAVGDNTYKNCNIGSWRDIVAITAGSNTVGLKSDGTVVAVGLQYSGECNSWRDIIAITSKTYLAGLKSDGTVVTSKDIIEDWRNIVAISSTGSHIVGLKSDGTVIAFGHNENGECNTGNWQGIVAISTGDNYTVGLKADGKVVTVGKNEYGQCNTGSWQNIGPVDKERCLQRKREDEEQRKREEQKCKRKEEEERKREEEQRKREIEQRRLDQQKKWASEGLCRYCGGKLSLFGRKCKSCGKEN